MKNNKIISPIPGLFYRQQSPEEPLFKKVGDKVEKGDVIGLVEVMKTFHEIKSDAEGVFKSFCVENQQPVQAGQVIAELED